MNPTQDNNNYPVFEVNQVLTNKHLNQAVNYLDEQERLTRANLIGIGIVCGLEISVDTTKSTITITKGCGITSEGYLIVQPENATLGYYKRYIPPEDIEYPLFTKLDETGDKPKKVPYELWEIVEDNLDDNKTGVIPLPLVDFWGAGEKVVLLFLELKKDNLRSCTPNSCDDQGSKVTATLRPLLIEKAHLDKIIATNIEVNQLGEANSVFFDREAVLAAQLNLPDFRLPRYKLPHDRSIGSEDILAAFNAVFNRDDSKLARKIGVALSQAYLAFKPIVQDLFPDDDPFADFNTKFGFLDTIPTTSNQVRFLQYYYDFFDDIIKAYDEFRWKGVALLCSCCPPDTLFPRHLMLRLVTPFASETSPSFYRHYFTPSPANSSCEARCKEREELKLLFCRLVEMVAQFTDNPKLPLDEKENPLIRITPSKLGDVPLSDKAIPYYYLPLFIWNAEKTRRNRVDQNLSYHFQQKGVRRTTPDFVRDPLAYDLEPYNFLRIEGHLGQSYQDVIKALLKLKNEYRLPINVIALRTGVFDDSVAVYLSQEDCRFEDLEAQYDALKAELIRFLCKEVQYFYDLPYEQESPVTTKTKPILPLLVKQTPDYEVTPMTVGRFLEDADIALGREHDIPAWIIIGDLIDERNRGPGKENIVYIYPVMYLSKIYNAVSDDLAKFNYDSFEKIHKDLIDITTAIEREIEQYYAKRLAGVEDEAENAINVRELAAVTKDFITSGEEIDDRLEAILYACRTDAFKVLYDEYLRRVREIKQKLFLNHFLQSNPGIQHKAGVPLGGTFILVYHAAPKLAVDAQDITPDIITQIVKEFADNTVIADFYLPYQCNSVCEAVQFVLPKILPKLFVIIGCTNEQGFAIVSLTVKGGLPPYDLKIDKQDYRPLSSTVSLAVGTHTLRICDAEGTESLPQTIAIISPITFSVPTYQCSADTSAYRATFNIVGGTPPYTVNEITITGNVYTTDSIDNGTARTINVLDSRLCAAEIEITHHCVQPTFSVTIGCANADGAPVNIILQGNLSLSPYIIKIDDGEYQPLSETLTLGVGEHTLTIRDAEGSESIPQTITVAAPIIISEPLFQYDEVSDTYTATLNIEGGTPPYTVNDAGNETVVDSQYTTVPIANGMGGSITVVDSHSCTAGIEFIQTYVTFNVTTGCPNTDSFSALNIIPKGGLSPYEIKINEHEYQVLNEISLPAGEYTLTIRDAGGTESLPQTITVTSAITFDSIDFKCSDDLQTYTATLMLSGGKPPYTINDASIDGNSYTTDSIASKSGVSINVLDSNQCPANMEISHNCCDLPCDGIALRRGYYFSLPNIKENFQAHLTFEYPQGNNIDMSAKVQKVLAEVGGDGNSFADIINKLIIERTGGVDCLKFNYEPSKSGFMDTWWIEYFECLPFEFGYSWPLPSLRFIGSITAITVTPIDSTIVITQRGQVVMTVKTPAFNTVKVNKCNPKSIDEPQCPNELDLKLEIIQQMTTPSNPSVILDVKPSGSVEPVTYLWEVQDGNPAMSNGQRASFSFTQREPNIKTIRLAAFTKDGCRFIQEDIIKLG